MTVQTASHRHKVPFFFPQEKRALFCKARLRESVLSSGISQCWQEGAKMLCSMDIHEKNLKIVMIT